MRQSTAMLVLFEAVINNNDNDNANMLMQV